MTGLGPRPLDGLRILDLTTVVMGPYASSILADMGADVIKLESPGGDILRQVGPSRSGEAGGMFLHANRGKRGIVLDLKSEEGRATALQLIADVDVLFYNLRPSAMERLGLSYEAVAAQNPGIIYVGAFGFGRDGRYADLPAYDDLIQGLAAIPALLAEAGDGTPRYVPVNIADRIVGLHAAIAILGAVHFRDRTGLGQRVDVSDVRDHGQHGARRSHGGVELHTPPGCRRLSPPADQGTSALSYSRWPPMCCPLHGPALAAFP